LIPQDALDDALVLRYGILEQILEFWRFMGNLRSNCANELRRTASVATIFCEEVTRHQTLSFVVFPRNCSRYGRLSGACPTAQPEYVPLVFPIDPCPDIV
jgi:hypothetical protein